ncbi:MAG: hypothetical protein PHT88_02765 [Candidatus Moranbacteria bacterium]|nr:hypothetical protein [Candidatus Moranbacteria bacterium]
MYTRNTLTSISILIIACLWSAIRFESIDTVEIITFPTVLLFAITLASWILCSSVSSGKHAQRKQLNEIQHLWLSYFVSTFPRKEASAIIEQLQRLSKAYHQWQSCHKETHTHSISPYMEDLPLIRRARSVADMYLRLITTFTIADEATVITPELQTFRDLNRALEISIRGVVEYVDIEDFLKKELDLSTCVIRMEAAVLEYIRMLRRDISRQALLFGQASTDLGSIQEALQSDTTFIAFFATLFPHEQYARYTVTI